MWHPRCIVVSWSSSSPSRWSASSSPNAGLLDAVPTTPVRSVIGLAPLGSYTSGSDTPTTTLPRRYSTPQGAHEPARRACPKEPARATSPAVNHDHRRMERRCNRIPRPWPSRTRRPSGRDTLRRQRECPPDGSGQLRLASVGAGMSGRVSGGAQRERAGTNGFVGTDRGRDRVRISET